MDALLAALLLHADDDLVALLPPGHEVADHLGRVLQVGDDADHGVAARLQQAVERRADVAEVARVDDHLDARVVGADAAQDLHRAVARGVVDEEVLVGVRARRRAAAGSRMTSRTWRYDLLDVLLFVVAGRDDAQERHRALTLLPRARVLRSSFALAGVPLPDCAEAEVACAPGSSAITTATVNSAWIDVGVQRQRAQGERQDDEVRGERHQVHAGEPRDLAEHAAAAAEDDVAVADVGVGDGDRVADDEDRP